MSKLLWVSHFSGCGGSTLGAIAAQFQPISAIEFDPRIAELYKANCGENITVSDIAQVDPTKIDIPSHDERRRNGQILVMQTSPPCQEFSQANKRQNRSSDRANILTSTYSHYESFKPEYVVLENVTDYRQSSVYLDFENFLIFHGYTIIKGVYNMADYGVPQTRKRFIAIAVRNGFPIPQIHPTHSQRQEGQISLFGGSLQQWVSWHSAIADLLPALPESKLTEKQKVAIGGQQNILVERVGYRDEPKHSLINEPCWTLRACLGNDGKESGTGRTKVIDAVAGADVRSLDTSAIARLQSFPDSYQWSGNSKVDLKGIGNSVCPHFMQIICEQIKIALGARHLL